MGKLIRCEVCSFGPAEGVTVFRHNKKGVPGIWRCRAHVVSPPLAAVEEITDILEGRRKT